MEQQKMEQQKETNKAKEMKLLITGAKGQLGFDVIKELAARGVPHKGVDLDDFDITNEAATRTAIEAYAPTAVIHCAAYTAVDKAEDEPELCRKINEDGTRNIANACKKINAKMLYISTDYVFPGEGEHFYKPTDRTSPLSVYGKTKLAGEIIARDIISKLIIIRTSWMFGEQGTNFVKTMLCLEAGQSTIDVVCDQIGSPTYTVDLAALLLRIITKKEHGIYHATNEGTCSWADFAQEIFHLTERTTRVNPITTAGYPAKAVRPLNSRLDKSCLDTAGFSRLPHWKHSLKRYLDEISKRSGIVNE